MGGLVEDHSYLLRSEAKEGRRMTTIVTGGTKGIGLAIAEHLARKGEPLVLVYHSDDAAAREALARVVAAATLVKADIGTLEGVAAAVDAVGVLAPGEPLHIVHSAATIYPTTL